LCHELSDWQGRLAEQSDAQLLGSRQRCHVDDLLDDCARRKFAIGTEDALREPGSIGRVRANPQAAIRVAQLMAAVALPLFASE
jgi:hypothetical protein